MQGEVLSLRGALQTAKGLIGREATPLHHYACGYFDAAHMALALGFEVAAILGASHVVP
jgi:hypothetical protein